MIVSYKNKKIKAWFGCYVESFSATFRIAASHENKICSAPLHHLSIMTVFIKLFVFSESILRVI